MTSPVQDVWLFMSLALIIEMHELDEKIDICGYIYMDSISSGWFKSFLAEIQS